MTELEIKTERLVNLIVAENLGGVLINPQHNFGWLTGGGSNGVDLSRENGVASLFVDTNGNRFVLANSIEMPRMLMEEISAADFTPFEFLWQEEKAASFIVNKARELADGKPIGTDIIFGDGASAIESRIAECRYELTTNEIERYRILGRDAGIAIRRVIDSISPGESEIAIAEKLRHELAQNDMTAVVTLVAADDRISQFRHPVPTQKNWNKTLMLVACAKRGGLIASLTRMICVGDVPEELQTITEAAAHVNARMHHATRPGVANSELYAVAENAYADKGYADEINLHHQGGATGYRTRDWVAQPLGEDTVRMNQAFAWNPSITGTKVEETCIVTEDGIENLTASPDFPQINVEIEGVEYSLPGVLSI